MSFELLMLPILLIAFGFMLFASVLSLHYITGNPDMTPKPVFDTLSATANEAIHKLIRLGFSLAHIIVLWSAIERMLSMSQEYLSGRDVNISAEVISLDFIIGMIAGAAICSHIAWLLHKRLSPGT